MYYAEDLNLAIDLAVKWHRGVFRKRSINGMKIPYIVHPINVMNMIWEIGLGQPTILMAAILHDVLEDSKCTEQEMEDVVGKTVTGIVKELTFKPDFYGDKKKLKNDYLESFAKSSIEALVVKLVDRISNSYDWMVTDPEYAKTYFHKAKPLFKAWNDRRAELDREFGEKIMIDANMHYNDAVTIFGDPFNEKHESCI